MGLIRNFDKTIHQMWWQGEEDFKKRPLKIKQQNSLYDLLTLQQCQKTYIDFCNSSDWSYYFWDEENSIDLVKQEFPQYYDSFQKISTTIEKCDCARAMILYVYGGLYVDLDTYLVKDLDEFLETDFIEVNAKEFVLKNNPQYGISDKIKMQKDYMAIFTQEPYIFEYYYNLYGWAINKIGNAVVFSSKRYPLWLDLIKSGFARIKTEWRSGRLCILDYFGPNALSLQVNKAVIKNIESLLNQGKINQDYGFDLCQNNPDVEIFLAPKEYFQYTRKINNDNQYIVHKFEGNWMK